MNNTPFKPYTMDAVTAAVRRDPLSLVEQAETHFDDQIAAAAARLCQTGGLRIVWLCGPSCVGKTTTCARLVAALESKGVAAFNVSLDDFYCDPATLPPDADVESPLSLRLDALHTCLSELVTTGTTRLPRFDFETHKPASTTQTLCVKGDAVVFFEGIQAFSPLLTEGLSADLGQPLKLFLNTSSRFVDNEHTVLARRDIRLARRLLRDERTRDSSFAETMARWDAVLAGADRYIFPYADDADITIDTTFSYEPCVAAPLLLSRLHTLADTPYAAQAAALEAAFSRFPALDLAAVPHDSVLREFFA